MTGAPITYEIRTLNDFKKVPKRRLRACLREFATCVELTTHMEALLVAVAKEMHGEDCVRAPLTVFRWIDDKQKNITAVIQPASEIVAASPAPETT